MAFVVPQHLPRAAFGQGSGYGSSTSHSEPILRKLAEATRESLTSTQASQWVKEIQKDIEDTKARVHKCIHKDLPAFERQLDSAKQIQNGLDELTSGADNLTSQVQRPQTGLLPAVLTTLAAHSTLAQDAQDAKILHAALMHLTQCRDDFKALSALVEGGHLPAAVRKSEETQSLIQSAPQPLERSVIMKDLSRMARVLGDRVQEQLGNAYSRAVAVTPFPTGVTIVVLPHVAVRDSNNNVTLSELFTSLKTSSLQEYLSTLRKDILTRALEPVLTKHSRLVVSTQEATLTIDHAAPAGSNTSSPTQQAQEALKHTNSIVKFLHDLLFPALPSKETFAAQLAGPVAQALVKHVLRASIPRSGSLKDIPEFIRVTERAVEVEVALFNMGLRSGDVREWVQAAPFHYERLRREDLVQHARGAVLEHDGTAVVVTRLAVREEEKMEATQDETGDDPWAFEEPAPATTPSVPIITAPAPRSQLPSAAAPEPPVSAPAQSAPEGYTIGEPAKPATPPPEDTEADGWGFDDDELETTEPKKVPDSTPGPDSAHEDTSEDEPDVEVYAGTSQSEAENSERSTGTSHPTELISAPHSDAEVINVTPHSSEESDPWDDDPWAESEEEKKKEDGPVPIPPSKSPAPTLSPTRAPEPPEPKPASPVVNVPVPALVEVPPSPATVEASPSPAVKTPAPRVARGLQRFAQKNRGSGASSPAVSNSSPTASFPPSSAFGTAPTSAFPTSAISHGSPTKSAQPLPGSSSSASFFPPEPPKIAAPVTPAMRRAQQQAKTGSQKSVKTVPGHSVSPVSSPTKTKNMLLQDDQSSSVGSVSGLFGLDSNRRRYAGSEVGSQVGSVVGSQVGAGSQVGFGSQVGMGSQVGTFTSAASPERTTAVPVPLAKQELATETYMVSTKAQKILALAEDALKEGKELVFSNVFPPGTTPTPGTLILGCIPSFFDLFRALVPVAHGGPMAASAGIALRFSNDCLYMSEEISRIIAGVPTGIVGESVRPKLQEAQEKLKVFSESWFEEVLDNEKLALAKYLEPTEGFKDLQDQTRYQECRRAITRCTHAIAKFSRDTKPVLSTVKYRLALGTLVEDILSRLTDDIISMNDIPETESHRLHDICKIMRTFESLFVPDGESDSMVSHHVPSWFKYSYLSELLEASLADIRHLFDIGALVDFSEQDLAHLIRALFSDSPKRHELIERVLAGHPVQA